MKLLLIRHGLPERTDTTSDAPLSRKGHEQAQALAQWLRAERIDALYSSPMQRALQTAEPLARRFGLEPGVIEGVAEYDRHGSRYVPIEDLKAVDEAAWRKTMAGQAVDNLEAFRERVVHSLQGIIHAHPGQTVAVTCHGGVINAWASHVLGMPARLFFLPDYTSINRFLCSSAGHLTLEGLNETAHLRARPIEDPPAR